MKYLIFVPILLVYNLIISIIVIVQSLWSFDFNQFGRRKRNLNHKLKFGYWLCDLLNIK